MIFFLLLGTRAELIQREEFIECIGPSSKKCRKLFI